MVLAKTERRFRCRGAVAAAVYAVISLPFKVLRDRRGGLEEQWYTLFE